MPNKAVLLVLITLNLGALAALAALLSRRSFAHTESIALEELKVGTVDTDGDGKYTPGDDFALEWLMANSPHHLEEAIKTGKRNEDGGIDISSYLCTVKPAGQVDLGEDSTTTKDE